MFHDYVQGAGLLRYELLQGETVDEFTLEILRQNTPEGVLLLGRETGEEGDFLLLPVAGLIPLLSDDNSVINKFTKDKFMEEVKTIQASLRDHMIPPDELVLRPEWTWLDPETGKLIPNSRYYQIFEKSAPLPMPEYVRDYGVYAAFRLEKNHVAPPSSQDEALSRYSVSGEVPR